MITGYAIFIFPGINYITIFIFPGINYITIFMYWWVTELLLLVRQKYSYLYYWIVKGKF